MKLGQKYFFRRAGLRGVQRQEKNKTTALSLHALGPNASAVHFDHGLCHRKPQPHAAMLAREVRFHLVKTLEDALQILGGDA
mgnify:CR=1 FL=1